eukprot:gb/GFBE01063586.1/.p1 GENE.gb/GFBE01063586.1/~~gb/GFBE01063586.1/.p1  ORF type:complete len:323 (+),score=83.79 gb/GFBE01063586.1/:1-969(+)
MALVSWLSLLLLQVPLAAAQLPTAGWCATGIRQPDFSDDGDVASIDVIVAQSPLFASNPSIGKKLGYVNLYHTALVLVQRVQGEVKNWTVEFDSVTNVLGAVLPGVDGDNLTWDNDARYCVTEGVLWGEAHWSKTFEVAMRLTAKQATRVFTEFVLPTNSSAPHMKPLYQLWKVVDRSGEEQTLIKDITCGDGTNWILNFASKELGVPVLTDFRLRFTELVFVADRVEPVKTDDPTEWSELLEYFKGMVHVVAKGQNIVGRLEDVLRLMPLKYVYDSNADTYFKIIGDRFPWFQARFQETALTGPPWPVVAKYGPEAVALLV